MNKLPKVLESKTKIRFQDCDPLNHLNNGKYIDYFINAREDQVEENYDLDIFKYTKKTGNAWVVGSNQIAYLKPANLMEVVTIESQLIHFGPRKLQVECRMWNKEKTELKAIFWSSLIHFNIMEGKVASHPKKYMELFEEVVSPVEEKVFEERMMSFRKSKV